MENPQTPVKPSREWHCASIDQALAWQAATADGLSTAEAQARLERYGPNRLQQAQGRVWYRRLLDQLNNILILILLVAAIASFLLRACHRCGGHCGGGGRDCADWFYPGRKS